METEVKKLSLFLAPWQKRMMKDFMPDSKIPLKDITRVVIKNPIKGCLASYKIPIDGFRIHDWVLYLTDEQIVITQKKLNLRIPIDAINITPDFLKDGTIAFD